MIKKSEGVCKKFLLGSTATFVGMLLISGSSYAQETNSEDIIIVTGYKIQNTSSAMKGNTPERDIPLSIAGYSREFIDSIDAIELSDLYNYMVGVQGAGPSGYDITIRGFQSGNEDRNSILIDGLPGATTNFGSPPTINLQNVEVVKGPASVLYGQVQPGGFINMITKKPQMEKHLELRARSQAFYGGEASFGDTLGIVLGADMTGAINEDETMAYRVVGEFKDQPSFYDGSFAKSYFLSPSVSSELGANTDVLLQLEYIDTSRPLYDGLVAFDLDYRNVADITTRYSEPGDELNEEGYGGTFTVDHQINDSITWHTALRGIIHHDDYSGLRNRRFVDSTTLRRQDRTQINVREHFYGDTNLNAEFTAGGMHNKILVGVNGGRGSTDFFRPRLDNGNATTNVSILDPVYGQYVPRVVTGQRRIYTKQKSVGVYIQDQISITEHLKAVAAVRYESFKVERIDLINTTAPHTFAEGNKVSPMAGLIYQPNSNWSIYGSYATSFTPPPPGASDINGNPIGEAQLGEQLETGVKTTLFDGRVNATASIFQIDKTNVTESLGNNVFALIGGERSKGVEFEVDAQIAPNWKVIAGYAYIDATVSADVEPLNIGQIILNVPQNTASLFTEYEIESGALEGLGLKFGVSYTGDRFGTLPKGLSDRLELPGYTVVDLGVSYDFEKVSVSLSANNILNETYLQSASNQYRIRPGQPASLVLSLVSNF